MKYHRDLIRELRRREPGFEWRIIVSGRHAVVIRDGITIARCACTPGDARTLYNDLTMIRRRGG